MRKLPDFARTFMEKSNVALKSVKFMQYLPKMKKSA